jgi:hypothetical protein
MKQIYFLQKKIYRILTLLPRWHSWIAQPPPKGQVAGSNPAWGAMKYRVKTVFDEMDFLVGATLVLPNNFCLILHNPNTRSFTLVNLIALSNNNR